MLEKLSDIRSPFAALRAQLKDIPPGDDPQDLTIGAPKHDAPNWVQEKIDEAIGSFSNYPTIKGTTELQSAIVNWATTRFEGLQGQIDESCILPLNGSREGLFYAIFQARARRTDIDKPIVLLPNPYYQVYGAAALAVGAEAYFLNATEETNFLPDLSTIPQEILKRTIALYLCTPSNPEGAIADSNYLDSAIEKARDYNFMLFSDECYSEIYRDEKPPSALEIAALKTGSLRNVCSFNSLSKRSNLPGIRSGLVLGDPAFIEPFTQFRNVAAPQIPGPIQHLSAHLWQDEEHVKTNRDLYNQKFDLAEKILNGRYSMKIPRGGFFLWLKMSEFGGGISVTSTLWKGCGLKILPGAYLSQSDHSGINPGEGYVRMALVGSLAETKQALGKLVRVLG